MSERNIVILGASWAGIGSAHYFLRHILPVLKANHDAKYHVYLISPASDFYYRIGSPRTAASTTRLPVEKLFYPLADGFKEYSKNDLTIIQATATELDHSSRQVAFRRAGSKTEESLPYHALIVATGSRTPDPAYSLWTDSQATIDAIKNQESRIASAKDIIVVGGGATGVEVAGEVGEFLNGKPGWFSTPPPKARITLITASNQILPVLRPALGTKAERKLKALGVDVLKNTRVADSSESHGRTTVTLAKGEKLEADLVIQAAGVTPNSEWLPPSLVDSKGYLITNAKTLRVDDAGPRVYALGDIGSYSRNNGPDVTFALPSLMINVKRDLLSYNPQHPNEKPKGKDREWQPKHSETQLVPVGSAGGVGAIFGWKVPSFFVWLMKSRDMMVGMGAKPTVTGDQFKKETKWSAEEAAI